MEEKIGHKPKSITLDDDGYVLTIVTDRNTFKYEAERDCCAHAYITGFDQRMADAIYDYIIHKVKIYESSSEDIDDDLVIDTAFYSIQTHGGDLDLELRTEHDGYYSGRIKFLSEIPHEDNLAK